MIFLLIIICGYWYKKKENEEYESSNKNIHKQLEKLEKSINLANYLQEYDYSKLKKIQRAYYRKENELTIIIDNKEYIINHEAFIFEGGLFNLDLEDLDDILSKYKGKMNSYEIKNHLFKTYVNRKNK